jgi:hypothetical protein
MLYHDGMQLSQLYQQAYSIPYRSIIIIQSILQSCTRPGEIHTRVYAIHQGTSVMGVENVLKPYLMHQQGRHRSQ